MNNHHVVWMYAKMKHAETLQEIDRYRLINQAKAGRKANRQPARLWLKSLSQRAHSLVSCVLSAPPGRKSVCLT